MLSQRSIYSWSNKMNHYLSRKFTWNRTLDLQAIDGLENKWTSFLTYLFESLRIIKFSFVTPNLSPTRGPLRKKEQLHLFSVVVVIVYFVLFLITVLFLTCQVVCNWKLIQWKCIAWTESENEENTDKTRNNNYHTSTL